MASVCHPPTILSLLSTHQGKEVCLEINRLELLRDLAEDQPTHFFLKKIGLENCNDKKRTGGIIFVSKCHLTEGKGHFVYDTRMEMSHSLPLAELNPSYLLRTTII